MSEAGAAKAQAGKLGGNLQAPPPDKPMDPGNCPHNVLVKRVRANEEIVYQCMKCPQMFKKPDELPKVQFQGGTK